MRSFFAIFLVVLLVLLSCTSQDTQAGVAQRKLKASAVEQNDVAEVAEAFEEGAEVSEGEHNATEDGKTILEEPAEVVAEAEETMDKRQLGKKHHHGGWNYNRPNPVYPMRPVYPIYYPTFNYPYPYYYNYPYYGYPTLYGRRRLSGAVERRLGKKKHKSYGNYYPTYYKKAPVYPTYSKSYATPYYDRPSCHSKHGCFGHGHHHHRRLSGEAEERRLGKKKKHSYGYYSNPSYTYYEYPTYDKTPIYYDHAPSYYPHYHHHKNHHHHGHWRRLSGEAEERRLGHKKHRNHYGYDYYSYPSYHSYPSYSYPSYSYPKYSSYPHYHGHCHGSDCHSHGHHHGHHGYY